MGFIWEDRLHIRELKRLGFALPLLGGFALAPDALSGDVSRTLVTFLGLFSASLLPTITLLVNGMTSSGRSVQAIERLNEEIKVAMDALFFIFGCIAIIFFLLLVASLKIPVGSWASWVPSFGGYINRVEQSILVLLFFIIVKKASQIPAILRRTLSMRKEIAIEEARRKLRERVPDGGVIEEAFKTHPDFGKPVNK